MELIGLNGYARSGKDEAAKVLVDEFGFTQVSIGDKLREALYALNPIVLGRETIWNGKEKYTKGVWDVQSVINEWGWDGYKKSPFEWEIRRLLQRLGTDVCNALGKDFWVNSLIDDLEDGLYVVTGVRLISEAKAIKDAGGIMVRINNPRVGPVNDHPSETALDDWDFDAHIYNRNDLEDYREVVRNFMYFSVV